MLRKSLLAAASATILMNAMPSVAEVAPQPLYSWTRMEWAFRNDAERTLFESERIFSKAPLAGVEADATGQVYVTTPRWLDPRVPSTLSKVEIINGKPLLTPFPHWEAHDLAKPDAIRNALGAFVDRKNRLWVLDMGFVAGETSVPDGAQKLIGYDLSTGQELVRFPISDDLANRQTSFLNDLTVDDVNEVIYITDSGNRGGSPVPAGIIVYDITSNTAHRVLDKHPSVQDDPAKTLTVNGEAVFDGQRLAVGINGITLSADRSTLYWSITTGDAIYSAPVSVLRDKTASAAAVAASVGKPMPIGGGSDGIATDPQGRIWITNLGLNRVEILTPGASESKVLFGGTEMIWPDSLANDFKGNMLLSTNHLNHAFGGKMDFDGNKPNFRIWRLPSNAEPQN
jgi:sugar lactone lactonase YvrE